jgi:steroid delta-isomerase-like uncharacterized protein
MSAQDNAMLARAAYGAFNERDFDRAAALVAEDLELINVATGETFRGPEGFRQYMQGWASAFSDASTEITNLSAGDDFAVVEFVGQGTHDGPLKGPAGEIPPTGRRVEIRFCEVHEIWDGKIVRSRTYFDLATMMGQLGLMSAPEQTAEESDRTQENVPVAAENAANQGATYVSLDEGKSLWLATDLFTFKAVGGITNGAYALAELTAQPQFGPPPHIHHREDESFYILEGEFEFLDDGRTFTAGAGSFVYLPKGRLHMHRAAGDAPARAMVLNTPAGIEKFIEKAGEPATDRLSPPAPPEMPELERIVMIAQKYGIDVPPPPER